jgi:hypothetical protein
MAQAGNKPKAKREPKIYPAEEKIKAKLEAFAKIKEPTDAQKAEAKTLRTELGQLRFIRLAEQRVPKALKAMDSIAKLSGSGYANTPEQAKEICKVLTEGLAVVESRLAGERQAAKGFKLSATPAK